ncbi:hypothetical protein [Acidithiobacillus caldus]|uniref:hypothetical protein n=1 Tax=Acidithiobacillus caldus TaxID=33059 RepID=UPI001C075DD6|nr:hypothetical protein [Acidithiobacillus caldus]MBU2771601.1 hypothetical protein [Acidithiobacillus caldus]
MNLIQSQSITLAQDASGLALAALSTATILVRNGDLGTNATEDVEIWQLLQKLHDAMVARAAGKSQTEIKFPHTLPTVAQEIMRNHPEKTRNYTSPESFGAFLRKTQFLQLMRDKGFGENIGYRYTEGRQLRFSDPGKHCLQVNFDLLIEEYGVRK